MHCTRSHLPLVPAPGQNGRVTLVGRGIETVAGASERQVVTDRHDPGTLRPTGQAQFAAGASEEVLTVEEHLALNRLDDAGHEPHQC